MEDSVLRFYDEMAEDYHHIFADWKQGVAWQGTVLGKFIRSRTAGQEDDPMTLLDCSCGIGTQAIGLAAQGFDVTATDLSPLSVERAKREATHFGVSIRFGVADFRSLERQVPGQFDVVLSADNALPHLLTDEDLEQSVCSLYAKVRASGLLMITIRDYDVLSQEKPPGTIPRVFDQGTRIVFQVWDWAADGRTYTTHHFIMRKSNGEWVTKEKTVKYRALLREDFRRILAQAGFIDIEWHLPESSGYYQPIVTARKSAHDHNVPLWDK
ncbi:class I SAM-dependent DNA methyltransferase [Camelliibacillus cellulosilyticus]|uniref:Class I SAM-dependent DNA methyltransferase n=1 Tax=Camelliibacillus cellulosilyticus TaxID=2174486 RepID=A0ABV9GN74_9BACL